ncbi:MAG: signal peptidase II [Pseudomonadota bacterium]
MTQRFKLILLGIGLIVLIGLDQYTKWLVLNYEPFNAMGCLEGTARCGKYELSNFLDYSMVWNRGMSFGAIQSTGIMRWVLFSLQCVIAGFFLFWYLIRERFESKAVGIDLNPIDRRLTAFALVLIIGGAIGNVIDRARFGAVVDFIDVSDIGFFPWVFNVADSAVTVGAGLLFLDFILTWRAQQKAGDDKDKQIS